MRRIFFVVLSVLVMCSSAFAMSSDVYASFEPDVVPYGELVGVEVKSLNPVTPSDTSGLKAVLLDLIGDYDAVVVEYEYESYNGSTNYLREVQPDYVWLCSAGLFVVVIYCLFRLGGALIRD